MLGKNSHIFQVHSLYPVSLPDVLRIVEEPFPGELSLLMTVSKFLVHSASLPPCAQI